MRRGQSIVFAIVAWAAACSGTPTVPSAIGEWGGDHIRLKVSETSSHVEFDCAHGDFGGVIAGSYFSLTGTFVREHGGPIREGDPADTHPAGYSGTVDGSRMTLTVRLTDSNTVVGTFALTRGATGRIVKCL